MTVIIAGAGVGQIVEESRSSTLEIGKGHGGSLDVRIETDRLVLTSIRPDDAAEQHEYVMGDPVVMEKFASGATKPFDAVESRMEQLAGRWDEGNPFSGFTIRDKGGAFMGYIVAGGGEEAGTSEIAYLLRKDVWQQGYGTEATAAVVEHFVPVMTALGYEVEGNHPEAIVATARKDNPGSFGILENLDFSYVRDTDAHDDQAAERTESLRREYARPIEAPRPNDSFEVIADPGGFRIKSSR